MLVLVEFFRRITMEGPEIAGPKVWLDLNRKCEAKIIAFINKNKARIVPAWRLPEL